MSDPLTYALDGAVARVTLDDGRANALGHEMIEHLARALARAEVEAKAVVLAGRPEKFCAGFDLKVMMSGAEGARALVTAGAQLLMDLYEHPLPTVAACTGHALAAGSLLLLASDTRIGADGPFKIGLNEVSIGMVLPTLAQSLAEDRISKRHLTRAALQAHKYAPVEAVDAGYLDRVVPPEEVVEAAMTEARALAELPTSTYTTTKRRLRERTVTHVRGTLLTDMRRFAVGT